MRAWARGFTLIELMVVVAVIGILAAIGIVQYGDSVRKSGEAFTKGNLGTLRSTLSIYYSNNEGNYPTDNLVSITNQQNYLTTIPIVRTQVHFDIALVTAETTATDTGGWSYNNSSNSPFWGGIHVGCLHQDMKGEIWTSY